MKVKKEITKIDDSIYYLESENSIVVSKARLTERRAISVIWDVYTDSHYRKKGYAFELIREIIEENDNLFILASICEDNTPSRKLFEKLGFVPVAKGTNPKTGNTVLLYLKTNSL